MNHGEETRSANGPIIFLAISTPKRITDISIIMPINVGLDNIHVKSPGFAGRLPEFSQIPRSPGRENESPGFLSY